MPVKVFFSKKIKKCITHPLQIVKRIFSILVNMFLFRQAKRKRYEDFETFYKKYFALSAHHYGSIEDLRNTPPTADIYLTGSDQVWNPFGNMTTIAPFFLDFGSENVQRISYAASWGRTTLPENEKTIIIPLLKKFKAVTVRETSGIELCHECGCPHAEFAPDPTLLLDAADYRAIMKCPQDTAKDEKYLLLYRLKNSDEYDYSKVFSFAHKKGLKVKYITGNGLIDFRQQCFPSIEEWLYMIDHAEYVVTNSFHGTVFAMIFKKQFAVIPLKGEVKEMNQRLDTLFDITGITPRYLSDFSVLDTAYSADLDNIHHNAQQILQKLLK